MKRIAKIKAAIRRKKADGLLITQPENRRYLSNYTATDHSITESSGILLVPAKGAPVLITDSRYLLQAEAEAAGCEVMPARSSLFGSLKKLLPRKNIRQLLFESHYMLHSTAVQLMEFGRLMKIKMVPASGMVERIRSVKSPGEIQKIQDSVILNEKVFLEAFKRLKPGQTEREAAAAIELAMLQNGAEGPAFPTIVAAGPNGALPHAVPTDRPIQKGETVIIDMGLKLDGYCSDMTRTVVLGRVDRQIKKVVRLVRKAQLAAFGKIRAGVPANIVDRAARQVIAGAGYGEHFGHGLGHGVGLAVHEAPSLNRLRRNKLQAGMIITVEPGIYLPGWGGVRLENMVVVEKKGYRLLNRDKTFLDL